MPVKAASYYQVTADIPILNSAGNGIGVLCFTKELGAVVKGQLTENQFIAFLTESAIGDVDNPYKFTYDYVVIDESFYLEYKMHFYDTAALWGSFYHVKSQGNPRAYTKNIAHIQLSKVKFTNEIFSENLRRAVAQPFAFERYLKLYHLLELRFDVDVIIKIQSLDIERESKKIGELLNNYSTKEIQRLTDILVTYCIQVSPIVEKLDKVRNFPAIALDIFYRFGGKESNPFGKEEVKLTALISRGFDENSLRFEKVNYQADYRIFILKLTAFWIYRVRCCIAHNKIGEYILSMEHEDFLVEFAEPLLKEILVQCFKA